MKSGVSILKSLKKSITSSVCADHLAKIRELHGSFKSICDNFAVNLTEFESIFSSNEATFAIWDTDNNGNCAKLTSSRLD